MLRTQTPCRLSMVDSDNDSVYSDVPLSPFQSPCPTISSFSSHDISMRSSSPAPSVQSMTSSMRQQAYKQEYGRSINNYSEVYKLAADFEECERLDKQHLLFREVMGKYPAAMYEVMRHDHPEEPKACLDLGCGSGAWIMDFARDFPQSTCVAVDLVPMQSIHMPQNCRSEVDDINLGMEHFYGDFNVVHARLISSGIQDYAALIDQASRVLRPGGLISLMEFDFHMYDENKRRIEVDRTKLDGPAWPRWLSFVHDIAKGAGGSVDAATYLYDWVQDHPLYEDVVYQEYYLPVSPWVGDGGTMDRIGSLMSPDCQAFVDSSRPMLLGSGMPEQLVNQLQRNAQEALQSCRAREYTRVQCVHARRPRTDPDL